MTILIIDGQGGGLGRAVCERLRGEWPDAGIIAVGTNAIATSAMLKAGATAAATGENAVIYNAARADIIIGAMGLLSANAMHGEISPAMAAAISAAAARKILVPSSRCNVEVVGTKELPMAEYVELTAAAVRSLMP